MLQKKTIRHWFLHDIHRGNSDNGWSSKWSDTDVNFEFYVNQSIL